MRWRERSNEAEMIAEFLSQELASTERYGATIAACLEAERVDDALLRHPDITNTIENQQRRRILARYRGYGTGKPSYLTGFPDRDVDWRWATLTPGELLETHYIRYTYWTALSAGTRSPVVAAARIQAGIDVCGVDNEPFHRLAHAIAEGATIPPLILVTVPTPRFLVALEGNTRLTAYALAAGSTPPEIRVLIGKSPAVARWDEY